MFTIDATGLHYKKLNEKIKKTIAGGIKEIKLVGVNGQRYIGTGMNVPAKIEIHGTAGADLGAFMDGPEIVVYGNAQDAVANTMNKGRIVIHGHTGDVSAIAMRGGELFIKDNVGYRTGIHMKEYKEVRPLVIIGGSAYDFLGEYMAGGILIVLNLNDKNDKYFPGNFIGTGMHGGVIYIRGQVEPYQMGKEVSALSLDEEDKKVVETNVKKFAQALNLDEEKILKKEFTKILPLTHRPYGKLYAY